MADSEFPSTWRDPNYIAGVVGTVATGALFFYSGLVESAPSAETITFVLLWILLPTTAGYEIARRWL